MARMHTRSRSGATPGLNLVGGTASIGTPEDRFDKLWQAFNYKHDRQAAFKTWLALEDSLLASRALEAFVTHTMPRVLRAAEIEARRRPGQRARGITPGYLQGWITRRRWESEIYDVEPGTWTDAQRAFIGSYLGADAGDPQAISGSPMSGLSWTEERAAAIDAALIWMPAHHWARAFAIVRAQPEILEGLKLKPDLFSLLKPNNAARLVDELTRLANERRRARGEAPRENPMLAARGAA